MKRLGWILLGMALLAAYQKLEPLVRPLVRPNYAEMDRIMDPSHPGGKIPLDPDPTVELSSPR
jgi:hypothetical protein